MSGAHHRMVIPSSGGPTADNLVGGVKERLRRHEGCRLPDVLDLDQAQPHLVLYGSL